MCYYFCKEIQAMTSSTPYPSDDEELERDLADLAELQALSKRLDAHEYQLDALGSSLDATKRLLSLKRKPPPGGAGSGSPV
jgi:hypothetical protein